MRTTYPVRRPTAHYLDDATFIDPYGILDISPGPWAWRERGLTFTAIDDGSMVESPAVMDASRGRYRNGNL